MIDENHDVTFWDLGDEHRGVDTILVNIAIIQQNAYEHGYGSSIVQPSGMRNRQQNISIKPSPS